MKKTAKATKKEKHYTSYQNLKQKYPNAIVLLRIANDYISFGQDAQIIDQIAGKQIIPIPGIHKACRFTLNGLDPILHKLVKAGNRVAVCDPLENPKR